MDTINLGRVEVFFRQTPAGSQPSPKYRPGLRGTQTFTLEEAQQVTGWKLWQPAYLPFPGMELEQVQILGADEDVDSVILKYKKDPHWLVIRQQQVRESNHIRRVPIPSPLQEEVVNNHPAAFFSHTVSAASQPDGQLNLLCCLWEHDDFLMELEAPHVSNQEAIKIAESLH